MFTIFCNERQEKSVEVKWGGRLNVTARNSGIEEECFGINPVYINQIKIPDMDEPAL